MRDYLSIGCSPADEECAQVGTENYWVRSGRECHAFLHQLTRIFGLAPAGAYLSVKTFPHDFGEYREVVCYFDTDVEESQEYAFRLESEAPAKWDEEARKELEGAKCSDLKCEPTSTSDQKTASAST